MRPLKLITLALLFPFISNAQQPVITTIAGNGNPGYGADNIQATASMLSMHVNNPTIDKNGDIYVCDSFRIRKIEKATGIITTIAGSNIGVHGGDGGPAIDATFEKPAGIAIASNGDLYISDNWANRVRKITKTTGIITTIAGDGTYGYDGENVPAASSSLQYPHSMVFDKAGNLYVAEADGRIRKIDLNGMITTYAGNGNAGNDGDGGPATSATVNMGCITIDTADNIYGICGVFAVIRKIEAATGIITTIAGTGSYIPTGDGGPALEAGIRGMFAWDIAADRFGNIYFTEADSSERVRRIDANGVISTVAGTAYQKGYNGDNIPAAGALLSEPGGVAVDSCGAVYVSEYGNRRIRKVDINYCTPASVNKITSGSSFSVYPNPAYEELHIVSGEKLNDVVITDATGRIAFQRTVNSEQVTVDVRALVPGVYFVKVGERVIKFVRE